jgi:hypothetical protein
MKILNHQRCPNKAWGHEEKSKGSKVLSIKKKKNNMMMLKTI